jgi:O-succinylbenzoate synthase
VETPSFGVSYVPDCAAGSRSCFRAATLSPIPAAKGNAASVFWSHMKIERIDLREIHMRLRAPFETSFGVTEHRRILLLQIHADGISGWGECTAPEGPFYISETIDTAWLMLRDFLIPRVLGKEISGASEIPDLLGPVCGNEMAKAVIETAAWHMESVARGVPLSRLIGGTMNEIPCGVSLGIQQAIDRLIAKVEREVAAGYQRIKLKIKPGKDLDVVREVRRRFPDINLSVDANSAYSLEDAEHLKRLDAFRLLMMEQPLAWDDMHDHMMLQPQIGTPICLDESIHHLRNARAAVEMGACRVLNIKLGRVGGHVEASKIQAYCASKKIPVWCGGMIESGIGRAHNIAMSTQAGFIWPGDVSASQRYWEEDIIEPEVEVTPQGTIRVSQAPGLGYAIRESRIDDLTVRHESFSALPESALTWGLYKLRLRQMAREHQVRLDERTRIARDLHDTLLQSFQGALLQFKAAYNLFSRSPENAERTLREAIDRARRAITEARDSI